MLTPSEGKLLVSTARRALELAFSMAESSSANAFFSEFQKNAWQIAAKLRKELKPAKALVEPSGVFVTLKLGGGLRGCIGYTTAMKSLFDSVVECALLAAFGDPRFGPLSKNELKGLELEVSVLTPFTPVENIGAIVVGKHGLYVEADGKSGLLLPQVATEQRWNVRQFIDGVYRKAGIWQGLGAKLSTFEAQIFQ